MINFRGFGEIQEDTTLLDEIDKGRKYNLTGWSLSNEERAYCYFSRVLGN